jgi:hypothetical protein
MVEVRACLGSVALRTRPHGTEIVVDLLRDDGTVLWPSFAQGPDELLACLAAEQRYLAEEVGHGTVRGKTYLDKARERLSRAEEANERIIEQSVRNRIIEYLELTASFAAQSAYERAAPIAHVPYEVINQWEDQLPDGPAVILEPGVYTKEELDALTRFHVVWIATAEAVPNDYPTLAEVQRMPAWEQLRNEAETTLAVFARRGRLSEQHEGH